MREGLADVISIHSFVIIGANVSEPHIDGFAVKFPYFYSALSMVQFLCCAYVCTFCLIFCGQRFLHSVKLTVMCMQLLLFLHVHALPQAHPTMSCIRLVIHS